MQPTAPQQVYYTLVVVVETGTHCFVQRVHLRDEIVERLLAHRARDDLLAVPRDEVLLDGRLLQVDVSGERDLRAE